MVAVRYGAALMAGFAGLWAALGGFGLPWPAALGGLALAGALIWRLGVADRIGAAYAHAPGLFLLAFRQWPRAARAALRVARACLTGRAAPILVRVRRERADDLTAGAFAAAAAASAGAIPCALGEGSILVQALDGGEVDPAAWRDLQGAAGAAVGGLRP